MLFILLQFPEHKIISFCIFFLQILMFDASVINIEPLN
jgi:hypothetical protein